MSASECSVAALDFDGHVEMGVATRTLWGAELGMEDRVGGITGALRLHKVMQDYQVVTSALACRGMVLPEHRASRCTS